MEKEYTLDLYALLRQETVASMGCTEPAALGFAASVAASLVNGEIVAIDCQLDGGTFKNQIWATGTASSM